MSRENTLPISFLLITGAGASRNFGGGTTIPLMNERSNALNKKLRERNPSGALAIGLAIGFEGTEFERRLGEFLHAIKAFPKIRQIVEPKVNFQLVGGLSPGTSLTIWFTSTLFHLEQINRTIQTSLVELFCFNQFNLSGAATAYSELFEQLKVSRN